ncbi:chromosome partitioning protein ParB [Nocardia sp. SYP-A9097]|uniref:ParB/Srx family N-terminal domain-containing protein n=1 Tax=Nocardia sp. SYP-A9097 TaxID=2663237 RepID=UPI00129B5E9F|nr:ParB/Srx family N-terminal domain-containing protein [Nocardia sp. SYP-A9097]MRH90568.1 chromosome partitioning protein ParB [Nocardia sp. SYP-A9097]
MSTTTVGRGRWTAAIAGALVALTSGITWVAPGDAGADPLCALPSGSAGSSYSCAAAGDLLDVRIGDVLATQPSLGYDEIYYKLGRYTLGKDDINSKFNDWCESNGQQGVVSAKPGARLSDPSSFQCKLAVGQETAESIAAMKTVVIGPGGKPYLTDGHHTLTSYLETPDGGADMHVRLRVLGNLSTLADTDFWTQMKANGWVWLKDVAGNPVAVDQLPKSLGLANFADDNYRSMMYFARDIGYHVGDLPFEEFFWGDWMRRGNIGGEWNRNDFNAYLATLKTVTEAQVALSPETIVAEGKTAKELDQLSAWNDGKAEDKGEFAKISQPYSADKPGKLGYAVEYRNRNAH